MPCTLLVTTQMLSCISVMPCVLESLGMLHKLLCTRPESDVQPLLGWKAARTECAALGEFCPGRDAFAWHVININL